MRIFVFLFIANAANSAPQGGYNYEPQQQFQIQLSGPQIDENVAGGFQFANQLAQQGQQLIRFELEQQQPQVLPLVQSEPVALKVEPAPKEDSQPRYPSSPLQTFIPPENHKPVEYNKEFFYLSAPQDDFEQSKNIEKQLESLRKNVRVLFIKAPEQNGLANAAIQLAKHSMDQQTVVYVLTKQHDATELVHKLQQERNGIRSKPDVIFVKYKTPEEAEHAQRTIQAQYEALEGPNHFNHQDVVSTHDFVGSTRKHQTNGIQVDPRKNTVSDTAAEVEAPKSKYLPPATKL